ncbi:hypothetical protein VTG60DRAFT_3863 [Thermothelomyces hinnuleus]
MVGVSRVQADDVSEFVSERFPVSCVLDSWCTFSVAIVRSFACMSRISDVVAEFVEVILVFVLAIWSIVEDTSAPHSCERYDFLSQLTVFSPDFVRFLVCHNHLQGRFLGLFPQLVDLSFLLLQSAVAFASCDLRARSRCYKKATSGPSSFGSSVRYQTPCSSCTAHIPLYEASYTTARGGAHSASGSISMSRVLGSWK